MFGTKEKEKTDEIKKEKCFVVKQDGYYFEDMENPPGLMYPCSDGLQRYQVDYTGEKPEPLKISDPSSHSITPALFFTALKMPASKEHLAKDNTLMQKISMGLMVVAILIIGISFAFT